MLRQIQPIPLFRLRRGGPLWPSDPHVVPFDRTFLNPQSGFLEFYMGVAGSNMNSGTDQNGTARYATTNGGWDSAAGVFTPSDGSNPSQFIQVGDIAHVFVDGATTPAWLSWVTQVQNAVNGTINLVITSVGTMGASAPATSGTARSLRVGGAFKDWTMLSMSNAAGGGWDKFGQMFTPYKRARFNIRNDQTYVFGGDFTLASCEPDVTQGYKDVPGDGGKATLDWGGVNGGNQFLQHQVDKPTLLADLIMTCNAGANIEPGLATGFQRIYYRMVIQNMRGYAVVSNGGVFVECEFYNNNKSNGVSGMIFAGGSGVTLVRCYIHDCPVTNGNGVVTVNSSTGNPVICTDCIFDSLGGYGIVLSNSAGANQRIQAVGCDFYNMGLSGIGLNQNVLNTQAIQIENCNFINNRRYGIEAISSTVKPSGLILNCGFYGNQLGNTHWADGMLEYGRIIYSTVPYRNPSAGDFTLLPPTWNIGRGSFTETAGGKSGTVGYPDIGAAIHLPTQTPTWGSSEITLPAAYVNHLYIQDWLFTAPTTLTLFSGTLPPGLSVAAVGSNEARIIGTPTIGGVGNTYDFVLRATSGTDTANATFHLSVQADPDSGSGGVSGG